ncbi:MAG: YihY/virulence factor BrkB family protein [Propionicimonas sp.]|uniref:YihY/virulence factor BrkB family protein n=1 Tax=Propionicimonas sp. TaxID=1955623 RepID=UPI003D119C7F
MTPTTPVRTPAPVGSPGAHADAPQQIPARGWKQVLVRGWRSASAHRVPLLAAGVAFFGFLALFPALIALTFVYGLVADPSTITSQLDQVAGSLPADARTLLADQLHQLTAISSQGLGWGLAISLVVALWSASGGVANLVAAINIAYDEERTRSFVKQRLVALALTLGAIVVMVVLMALVAGVPVVLQVLGLTGGWRWVAEALRWILVIGIVLVSLAVLYQVAPDRRAPKLRWASVGAVVATLLWVVASVGFSLYVSMFGSYARTYGALAGVVVMLLWLWITAFAVLLGAEINAEAERQTAVDTTRGPDRPAGARGAKAADEVAPPEA